MRLGGGGEFERHGEGGEGFKSSRYETTNSICNLQCLLVEEEETLAAWLQLVTSGQTGMRSERNSRFLSTEFHPNRVVLHWCVLYWTALMVKILSVRNKLSRSHREGLASNCQRSSILQQASHQMISLTMSTLVAPVSQTSLNLNEIGNGTVFPQVLWSRWP
jgi:hypothetical protein